MYSSPTFSYSPDIATPERNHFLSGVVLVWFSSIYYRTDRLPIAPVAPARAQEAAVEVQAYRAPSTDLARCRTPIEADRTGVVERRTVPPTCSREKDTIAGLLALYLITSMTIQCGPLPGAIVLVEQLPELGFGGHAPTATPLCVSYIPARAAYVAYLPLPRPAIIWIVARLGLRLSPCKVITVIYRSGGPYVACSPLHAQSHVDIGVAIALSRCKIHVDMLRFRLRLRF